MKTTFSYFPGMFGNPAPAKIIFKKILKTYPPKSIILKVDFALKLRKRISISKRESIAVKSA